VTVLTLINGANLCERPCCSGRRVGVVDDAVMQERLAYAIRAAMAKRGIVSARDLARRMNRDATTVNRWITGKSVPNALVIRPLPTRSG
jgi:ribosome-binding protein aMBF1 (putative translation factor)